MARAIPILMYHQVSPFAAPSFRKYVVSPRMLAAQMRWLALAGYRSVGLEAAVGARQHLPKRPFILTFDDGYQDCATYVPPILRRWGFGAVFFLVAGVMGRTSHWLLRERGIELPLMDWATARDLERSGFSCASHTLTHPRLATISPAACRRELEDSRALLEDHLGHPVRDLAYPYGSVDAHVRALAGEAGYRSACSVSIGLSGPGDDPLALRRVPVTGQDSLLDFIWRLHTGLSTMEWLRTRSARGSGMRAKRRAWP
jgi:peptidoglycan/xylan/chitin deacetylase (PgdA/CDA1 family)